MNEEAILKILKYPHLDKVKRKAITDLLKKLIQYRDATAGLWATDLPGAVKDPKKVMFEIKYE